MTRPADDQSHSAPEESFISILYDITRKHPVIFIGLYITVTTEKLNRQKDRLTHEEMDRIKTQTSLLVHATESLNALMIDVSGKVNEKVQLMEGTAEVLDGITKVIESVHSQGNNLLVLSNTARIEGISHYRMEYVAKHANLKRHELKNATQFDYARRAEALQRDCTDVENTLKEVSIYLRNLGADARVQFATLNDQPQALTAHPFLKYLGKVFNGRVIVEAYRPGSNTVLNPMEGTAHHKRFLVPAPSGDSPNPQEFLVQKLYEPQGQAIRDDPHIVSSMTELLCEYENDAQMATRVFMAPALT